jgi:pimeloyl-ACP methyl ester carboxylesterase
MINTSRLIYIHGSQSDSNSGKGRLFRERFPGMVTPDFKGSFDERMSQLRGILADQTGWTLIGSSYGGLMATIFTLEQEDQVRRLVLLAPALTLDPPTPLRRPGPISVPTIIVHGTQDTVIPFEPVREIARGLFSNLTLYPVEDDHRLQKTASDMDWNSILME